LPKSEILISTRHLQLHANELTQVCSPSHTSVMFVTGNFIAATHNYLSFVERFTTVSVEFSWQKDV